MAKMSLLRHSVSQANEEGICDSGRLDSALSLYGQAMAVEQAGKLKTCPDAIYTSTMKRAAETAAIYAMVLKQKFGTEVPVILQPNLHGQDNGSLEGLEYNSLLYKFLKAKMDKSGPEEYGGESDIEAGRRQLSTLQDVAASIERRGYQNVLVFTHSDAIAWFLAAMEKAPVKNLLNCQRLGPFDTKQVIEKISFILQPPAAPASKRRRLPKKQTRHPN